MPILRNPMLPRKRTRTPTNWRHSGTTSTICLKGTTHIHMERIEISWVFAGMILLIQTRHKCAVNASDLDDYTSMLNLNSFISQAIPGNIIARAA